MKTSLLLVSLATLASFVGANPVPAPDADNGSDISSRNLEGRQYVGTYRIRYDTKCYEKPDKGSKVVGPLPANGQVQISCFISNGDSCVNKNCGWHFTNYGCFVNDYNVDRGGAYGLINGQVKCW